ncbi:MAG: GUN4 domain-containing protein [Cyanobacteriota bacterium]|nr:GUN4 domain-containing protein [Cyanobacteriota bacterium]
MLSGAPVSSSLRADQLLDQFLQGSDRQARTLVQQLRQKLADLAPLIDDRLRSADPDADSWRCGFLLQLLEEAARQQGDATSSERRSAHWLNAPSAAAIDYAPLQRHLLRQEFEAADRLTSCHLRQLAGAAAERRGYVYFSEVAAMPALDLDSLDRLWLTYSLGRFAFSVQGRLLRRCQGRWEDLWPLLGWKREGVWTRYPSAFTWSLEAPEGHMPLINQLRGVRLMDALLRHPAVARRTEAAAGPAKG